MENKTKVCFKNLSTPLKVAIVMGYVTLVSYAIAFLIGFIEGLIGQ